MMQAYIQLLIKQYWRSPKARADIALRLGTLAPIADVLLGLADAFDVDQAVGRQLDIIGRIVGLVRRYRTQRLRQFFGFSNNPRSLGFGHRFDSMWDGGPLMRRGGDNYEWQNMPDDEFRRIVKAKIAANNTKSTMVDPIGRLSVQDVVLAATDGMGYVVDNQDMTMALIISPQFPADVLWFLLQKDLLARPLGLWWRIIQAEPGQFFGFSSNPNAKGFGVGTWARKFF